MSQMLTATTDHQHPVSGNLTAMTLQPPCWKLTVTAGLSTVHLQEVSCGLKAAGATIAQGEDSVCVHSRDSGCSGSTVMTT